MSATTMLVVESSRKEKKSVLRLEVRKYLEDVCEPEEETGLYRSGVFLFGWVACRQRPLQCFWREFQLLQIMRQRKSYCH